MKKSVSSWGWEQGHKDQVIKARRLYSKVQKHLKERGVEIPNLPKEQEAWKWYFDDIEVHSDLLPKKEGKRCYFYYEYFKNRRF